MNEVLKKLGEIGIIPVVVLDDAKDGTLWQKMACDLKESTKDNRKLKQ